MEKYNSRLGIKAAYSQMGSAERIKAFKVESRTPGPGTYIAPSAFGIYTSKIAVQSSYDQMFGSRSRSMDTAATTKKNSRSRP